MKNIAAAEDLVASSTAVLEGVANRICQPRAEREELAGRPKATAETLAASQNPPAGNTWQPVAPREGQKTLRVRPNPLFLTHGRPHHAWLVLDEDNREVARAHDVEAMDAPLEAATREVVETEWHCGRREAVRKMSAHVETAGRLMCQVGLAEPVPSGGQ